MGKFRQHPRNITTAYNNKHNLTILLKHERLSPSSDARLLFNSSSTDSNVLDQWQPQPHWSIAPNNNVHSDQPPLTSAACYDGLVSFFHPSQHHQRQQSSTSLSPHLILSLATEASSHPSGLSSVYAQPWVYAGGGLGNMDECPLQTCLAGGTSRDSLTFASVCVPQECTAHDLFAPDFVERLTTAAFDSNSAASFGTGAVAADINDDEYTAYTTKLEYIRLHTNIAQVGKFLQTGWVCGEYVVEWQVIPSLLWGFVFVVITWLSLWGTFGFSGSVLRREQRPTGKQHQYGTYERTEDSTTMSSLVTKSKPFTTSHDVLQFPPSAETGQQQQQQTLSSLSRNASSNNFHSFWSAWDMTQHIRRLVRHRPETASLDGLKVGSILWIIGAHVMAIQSSTAAGYLNPKDVLPPHGITTTLIGQLIFSSRYAVDTFLCISGFLAFYTLKRKWEPRPPHVGAGGAISKVSTTSLSPAKPPTTSLIPWTKMVGGVIAWRLLRILPLYLFCLTFWMYVGPHLGGGGPFSYQWENFLQPCRESWWTNILFVNNFLPWGVSTTANCFYHSWYLAVDVQLFVLFSPWLVLLYQRSQISALRVAMFLWLSSVVMTAVLTYTQQWSVNTFDGAAVALFDVEGYAKPHVRAQSYLAGILVAMWPPSNKTQHRTSPQQQRSKRTHRSSNHCHRFCFRMLYESDGFWMGLPLFCLLVLSLVTVTGAYHRRACTFEELPAYDDCGSTWTFTATFLYTAFSRALWSIGIATIMYFCLELPSSTTDRHDEEDYVDNEHDDDDDNYDNDDDVYTYRKDSNIRAKQQPKMDHSPSTCRSPTIPKRTTTTMKTTNTTIYYNNPVKFVLSWNIWTPLAHLSYGAYLIHPMVILIWKLGGSEKYTFRVSSFVMDVCSITVVTFILSLIAALLVEFPFAVLLSKVVSTRSSNKNNAGNHIYNNKSHWRWIPIIMLQPSDSQRRKRSDVEDEESSLLAVMLESDETPSSALSSEGLPRTNGTTKTKLTADYSTFH